MSTFLDMQKLREFINYNPSIKKKLSKKKYLRKTAVNKELCKLYW